MNTDQPGTPIQPVRLVRDPATPGVVATPASLPWLPIAGAVVGIAALVLVARWALWTRRTDLGTRTFLSLARRRKLSTADRDLLRSLAGLTHARPVHPVALLLSPDAFARAADLAVRARVPWADRTALTDLHARAFRP